MRSLQPKLKRPITIVCHQCQVPFEVRHLRNKCNCSVCNKKHVVKTRQPTPYRKVFYWNSDHSEMLEVPRELWWLLKNDPYGFGAEIGLRAIPLQIVPYTEATDIKLYKQGLQEGKEIRRSK